MMNKRVLLLLLMACMTVALMPVSAFAANTAGASSAGAVYASAAGNDDNDGSKGTPFKTIGKAYDEVANGGTIYLL